MAKYLEYEKASGHIVSEIISVKQPEVSNGYGLLEIDDNTEIDTRLYAIKNGVLVKNYETNEERLERERLKKEHTESVRKRVKSMMYEVCISILENDDDALDELRREYKELKAYL